MHRTVRRHLLLLGLWPSLLDAAVHVAWKLQLFSIALLHLLFSSDKQWLLQQQTPSTSAAPTTEAVPSPVIVPVDAAALEQPTALVTKSRRIVFVRHAESEWNVVFNSGFNLRALARLVRAVLREWLLLPTGDSVFLDSPLSRRGRFQAQQLKEYAGDESLEGGRLGGRAAPVPGTGEVAVDEGVCDSPHPTDESAWLHYLCCPLPGSVVATSNLRRSIDTARIASAPRLEVPGERIHVLSCLQEIGRNVDTLAISQPHSVQPREVLVKAPRGEKRHDELFNVAESHGNKAVLGSGRDRLLTFAQWLFKQPNDVAIVYGHSLWLRAFCREFFPRHVPHEAKSATTRNCGVVTFVLEEHSRGGGETPQYTIQPESFRNLV
ncbi:unnamed protein product [Hyaloperonospora brassicae]|uniref:RxLR effector candidate protein n=1 Tax=Hyaloperonospora brassicae TaxID=162125 RepID=A0AAV0SUA6_HYABA|nr:unnamed protein product [Hyaloperonospora brassicae]